MLVDVHTHTPTHREAVPEAERQPNSQWRPDRVVDTAVSWADFMDAIAKKRRPVRDIEIGYRATNAALLGMVSWRLGRSVKWDGNQSPGDAEANKLLRRAYRKPWEYPLA